MNEELPDRMPPRPFPATSEEPPFPPQLPPTTKVPRVFGIRGTICYGISAIASITALLAMAFTGWTPPWWFLTPAFLYIFVSAGGIFWGRVEANKESKQFMQALRKQSEDNERAMRWMN